MGEPVVLEKTTSLNIQIIVDEKSKIPMPSQPASASQPASCWPAKPRSVRMSVMPIAVPVIV